MAVENEHILTELECLVCNEYMYAPIKQCSAGHSMCEICFKKVSSCPTCRAALGNCRNFALENILSRIQIPCKYKGSGCAVVEVGVAIKAHEEFCEHGERSCPLKDSTNCTWTGKIKDFVKHAKENHDQHPPVLNDHEARIKNFLQKTGEGKHYQLLTAHNKIFKYCVNLSFSGNIIQWNVQFVGPRDEASNYSYIITFIDKNKATEKYTITSTCQPLVKDDQAFTYLASSTIYFDKLKQFCNDDNSLYFYFKIMLSKDLENTNSICTSDEGSIEEL